MGRLRTWWLILVAPAAALAAAGLLHPWALPLVNALLFFPHFYACLTRGQRLQALLASLLWAAATTAAVAAAVLWAPAWSAASIANGEAYRAEMFTWLRTGQGAEGDWRLFLPQHAVHLAGFAAACLLSGGLLGLALGSYLLGYMGYYLGHLLVAARAGGAGLPELLLLAVLGYSPWAATRVVGYILLAISLSEVFYRRVMPLQVWYPKNWWCAWAGLTLVLADLTLKALLAEPWRRLLRGLLGEGL